MAVCFHMPFMQQSRVWRKSITEVTCRCSTAARLPWNQRRSCASFARILQPSAIPLASSPPLHDTVAAAPLKATREDFAAAFARATADAVHDHLLQGGSRATPLQGSGHLSAWTEYLVGLRDVPPSNPFGAPRESGSALMSGISSSSRESPLTSGFVGSQGVFVRHVFDDVKETTLYATVRPPEAFLRPEQATTDSTFEGGFPWHLMPLSAALKDMEAVLQDMLMQEQQGRAKRGSDVLPASSAVTFWRAMLEQAFLAQYCALAVLQDGDLAAPGRPQHWLLNIYPHDYSRQPAGLRGRLERGIRALLCASAYTLHIHWEQYMARHSPTDSAAQVLGLEFVMLWWWANPDQMTVELSLPGGRLPPPTLQSLRQRGSLEEATVQGWRGDDRPSSPSTRPAADTSIALPSVEHHLQHYLAHHFGSGGADAGTHPQSELQMWQQRRRRALLCDGGFLSPAAVFPPAYLDALRTRVAHVRHRKNLITCPLFPRLIEVALAVGTSDTATSNAGGASASATHSTQRKPRSAAARRGREIALQLCHEWLWPVICGRAPCLTIPSTGHPLRCSGAAVAHAPLHAAPMEAVEDWAVLMAAVAAVSQVRGNLLALRRAGGSSVRGRPDGVHCATLPKVSGGDTEEPTVAISESGISLAHVRDHLYMPLVRALLISPAGAPSLDGERALVDCGATVPDDMPGWLALVFTRVSACFEEAGMLQRDVALQPATPARLWCLLFHCLCDTFPNVFHSGNTVTVMWTLLALEGVCTLPSLYYGTYRVTNVSKAQTMSAWWNTLAASSSFEVRATERAGLMTLPRCADESEAAAACSLCPRSERCQRTAFVLSTAVVDASASDSGPKRAGIGGSSAHVWHGRRPGTMTSLPSFASAPAPELPLQVSSPAALAQAQAHLASCAELSEEVVAISIEIFRRYARLPVLVPGAELLPSIEPAASVADVGEVGNGRSHCRSSAEAVSLRHQGHPSLLVLLRLLQVAALFGEVGNTASDSHPGLVDCVVSDLISACHPVVAVYLRKLRVYAAAVSGRSGALALLHNEALQGALDSLPPSLGRQRLVKALLWSGLPVSALEKGAGSGTAVYGSGSLAWYVLERNQQRFLAFTLPNSSAAASVGRAEDRRHKRKPPSADEAYGTGSGAEGAISSFSEVVSCLDEILRHLWQLAIAIPDTARVALCIHPYVNDEVTRHSDPDAGTHNAKTVPNGSAGSAAKPASGGCDGVAEHEPDSTLASSDDDALPTMPAAADGEGMPAEVGYESDAALETSAADWPDGEAEGADTPADWSRNLYVDGGFDSEVAVDIPADEDAHTSLSAAPLWDSRAAVRSSVTLDATHSEDDVGTATDSSEGLRAKLKVPMDDADRGNIGTHPDDYRALAQALLLATPAAQHIFSSLLEVLSWSALPQTPLADSAASLALDGPLGHAQVPGDFGRHWRARLAANYSRCVAVWQAHCRLTDLSTAATPGAAVLCRPQTMERIALLLLHSCPDVFALGLLLLAMAGGTANARHLSRNEVEEFERRVRNTGSLLPWSVESSVAQLLFHAGVTAANVRLWRKASGLTDNLVPHHRRKNTSSAALLHVTALRTRLERVTKETRTPDRGGSTSTADQGARGDLLLSIGSLLLCSLEQRCADGSGRRALYRYNAYVNEFLLHRLPAAEECKETPSRPSPGPHITTLRVLLPSAQLKSSSPSTMPPQQIVSLRLAWQRTLRRSKKIAILRCFRNRTMRPPAVKDVRATRVATAFSAQIPVADDSDYSAPFL
ncbi:hypothetical protein CUR178_01838 [Leishmania enriettii]|uniref:Uncharacterized protein n=1 Tax=Leishmania enriettii TaxID=5663 RepID=A0A836KGA5_LEIEN|nr:hypothetical protein CUR178_01838 [Leishmania enriettii]